MSPLLIFQTNQGVSEYTGQPDYEKTTTFLLESIAGKK